MMDSAAKHTMACRVDEDRMHAYADTQNILQNKHKYCVNRHELVLNTNNDWKPGSIKHAAAYPHIVSNLGDVDVVVKQAIRAIYELLKTPQKLALCRDVLNTMSSSGKFNLQFGAIPFFHAQGYSLGVAYANHRQGDIVCAVQVGGMLTVRNGHFTCQTGDMIQWYFDFEAPMFQEHDADTSREGERKTGTILTNLLRDCEAHRTDFTQLNTTLTAFEPAASRAPANSTTKRKRHVDMQLGMTNAKTCIPYPKPYIVGEHGEHYGDRIRVFAKCMNGGRPHDMVDIMLMTQSL